MLERKSKVWKLIVPALPLTVTRNVEYASTYRKLVLANVERE